MITYFWKDPARKAAGHSYEFTVQHIEILRNMVRKNLTIPHQFVCITDESIPAMYTAPINWWTHVPGTVYVRLGMRHKDFADHVQMSCGIEKPTRFLMLDIDVVLTGNIDHLITKEDRFWRNPNWPLPRRAFYQSSVQLFTPGEHHELYDEFDPKDEEFLTWINHRFGGREQAWLSERLSWLSPYWDWRDGLYGAGRLANANDGVGSELPANACLVSFPGNRLPDQPETIAKHPWIAEHYR